jgi:hypothetical protein
VEERAQQPLAVVAAGAEERALVAVAAVEALALAVLVRVLAQV